MKPTCPTTKNHSTEIMMAARLRNRVFDKEGVKAHTLYQIFLY